MGTRERREGNTEGVGTHGLTESSRNLERTSGPSEALETRVERGREQTDESPPAPTAGQRARLTDRVTEASAGLGARRDFRRPQLSFLAFETGTGAGGKGGAARLQGSLDPTARLDHHPGARPGARGRGGWGPASGAAPGSAHGEGSVRQTRTGPAAGELAPRPRRGGRTPGVAQEIPGPPPPVTAAHGSARGRGGADHPGAGPSLGPPPPWARPLRGPACRPPVRVQQLGFPQARHSGPLRWPGAPPAPPRARTGPQKGPHFTEGAEAPGALSHPTPRTRSRGGDGGGSPVPSAGAWDSRLPAGPPRRGLRLFSSCWLEWDAAGLGACRQAG